MNNYCIKDGYKHNLTPAYYSDVPDYGKGWQPEVYNITNSTFSWWVEGCLNKNASKIVIVSTRYYSSDGESQWACSWNDLLSKGRRK